MRLKESDLIMEMVRYCISSHIRLELSEPPQAVKVLNITPERLHSVLFLPGLSYVSSFWTHVMRRLKSSGGRDEYIKSLSLPSVFNPFNTGTHFYLQFWVRFHDFIDIRRALWRSED